jgi:Tfp pilus assembly protein PilF
MTGRLLTLGLVIAVVSLMSGCVSQQAVEKPKPEARSEDNVSEVDKHYYLGAEYFRNKMYGEATRELKIVLDLDPSYEKAYTTLGYIYIEADLMKP